MKIVFFLSVFTFISTLPVSSFGDSKIHNIDTRKYERTNHTINWKKLLQKESKIAPGDLVKFALSSYLQTLVHVMRTHDRKYIDEYFEGLLQTDFYQNYGMSYVGGKLGEITYKRYLTKYINHKKIRAIAKENFVMATSMLLPEIMAGERESKPIIISLSALGLSTNLIKGTARSIPWLHKFSQTQPPSLYKQYWKKAPLLLKSTGFVYSVTEQVVIVLLADEIEQRLSAYQLQQQSMETMAKELARFSLVIQSPSMTKAQFALALNQNTLAWHKYRNDLYRPLLVVEKKTINALAKIGRKSKIVADRRVAVKRIENYPVLLRNVEDRHGSLEAYAEWMVAGEVAELYEQAKNKVDLYLAARKKIIDEIFTANIRTSPFLDLKLKLNEMDWQKVANNISQNRPQNYSDQKIFYEYISSQLHNSVLQGQLENQQLWLDQLQESDTALMRIAK